MKDQIGRRAIEVIKYRCELHTGNAARITLFLNDPRGFLPRAVMWFRDEPGFGDSCEVKVLPFGSKAQIAARYDFNRYEAMVDLLRNETPIYIFMGKFEGKYPNGTINTYRVQTAFTGEPVGEEEALAGLEAY